MLIGEGVSDLGGQKNACFPVEAKSFIQLLSAAALADIALRLCRFWMNWVGSSSFLSFSYFAFVSSTVVLCSHKCHVVSWSDQSTFARYGWVFNFEFKMKRRHILSRKLIRYKTNFNEHCALKSIQSYNTKDFEIVAIINMLSSIMLLNWTVMYTCSLFILPIQVSHQSRMYLHVATM